MLRQVTPEPEICAKLLRACAGCTLILVQLRPSCFWQIEFWQNACIPEKHSNIVTVLMQVVGTRWPVHKHIVDWTVDCGTQSIQCMVMSLAVGTTAKRLLSRPTHANDCGLNNTCKIIYQERKPWVILPALRK